MHPCLYSPRFSAPRSAAETDTDRITVGQTVRRRPPAVALCWHCGAAADRLDPPGWVVALERPDPVVASALGVCPACRPRYCG